VSTSQGCSPLAFIGMSASAEAGSSDDHPGVEDNTRGRGVDWPLPFCVVLRGVGPDLTVFID
jgi:hypothetical protein